MIEYRYWPTPFRCLGTAPEGIHPTYKNSYERRVNVSKTLRNMGDDRWKTKGHAHASVKDQEPVACPHCMGRGTIIMNQFGTPEEVICYLCKGSGEISR